ncbi:hypothetical protein [Roseibium sp.]|uniref:hypothetical protein n=1 Tax=Roseibium sp. TaxID=1936156 RepID=UPI003BA99DCB
MDLNKYDIQVLPVIGGYIGYLRLDRDGGLKPILGKRGKPVLFASEFIAFQTATRHLLSYINGHLVRDGEVVGTARKQAEELFKKKDETSGGAKQNLHRGGKVHRLGDVGRRLLREEHRSLSGDQAKAGRRSGKPLSLPK